MQLVAELVFEAARPVADQHGVGIVVIVVDATERVQYQTNLGATMIAGACARCACLYDAKPRPPERDPGAVPHGVTVGGGGGAPGGGAAFASTAPPAPGGGVAGGAPPSATGGNAAGPSPGDLMWSSERVPDGCRPLTPAEQDSLLQSGRSGIALGVGVYSVVCDPPGAGGEGRTGSSGGMSATSPSNPPGAGEGRTLEAPVVMDQDGNTRELGAHLDLDAMNRGRAARGMPTLTRAQLEERLASLQSGRSGIALGVGVYSVVCDPPGAGGEGRTGSSGGMSATSPSNPPGAGEGHTLEFPNVECPGCLQPFPAADGYRLRSPGKLFAFEPGTFCPDCAAKYDRGELVRPT